LRLPVPSWRMGCLRLRLRRAEGARRPLLTMTAPPLTEPQNTGRTTDSRRRPLLGCALGLDVCLALTMRLHRLRFPARTSHPGVGLLEADLRTSPSMAGVGRPTNSAVVPDAHPTRGAHGREEGGLDHHSFHTTLTSSELLVPIRWAAPRSPRRRRPLPSPGCGPCRRKR
jgi:hypothetical protein